ncbi:MAG: ATP-binding cassette domain-containing protein [Alphaproteobacteria bacterium]|nr:ATP-binding cassette domain-containing protein [Alphaproteobacteria bacterium]
MSAALVSLDAVSKRFALRLSLGDRIAARLGAGVENRAVRAVEAVSLEIARGETLGLVGESGCGKSTLGRIAVGILAPDAGEALIDGQRVMEGGPRPVKRTTRIQTVFQDPFASLDPRMKIGDIVAEGPIAHGFVTPAAAPAYVAEWLARVGLEPDHAARYPHQFSGGQRQRVAIARALAMRPDVLVCDEPVASLDVSIQAQIVNLFLDLKRELGLTMLFISHDLGVVRHLSERIAIMYLGRVVELGSTAEVLARPHHPYTKALLDSVPKLVRAGSGRAAFKPIAGEIPSPLDPPAGCHFHPRCPHAFARCRAERPNLAIIGAGRHSACLREEHAT